MLLASSHLMPSRQVHFFPNIGMRISMRQNWSVLIAHHYTNTCLPSILCDTSMHNFQENFDIPCFHHIILEYTHPRLWKEEVEDELQVNWILKWNDVCLVEFFTFAFSVYFFIATWTCAVVTSNCIETFQHWGTSKLRLAQCPTFINI